MAQPTTKTPEALYRSLVTKGTYRIAYKAKSGVFIGVPSALHTDLLTLEKVGGSTKAPNWIFTSQADFLENFDEHNPLREDTPEGTRTETV